jgi:SAM-dependent methyltransferase
VADERITPGGPSWDEHSAPHLARYFFAAELAKGRRVLDAGTGGGYGPRVLMAGGAVAVQAVDCDEAAIRLAERDFGGPGIEFLVDDCQRLDRVAPPFDLVCSFENIEHLEHPERFPAAAARVLAPGGMLVVSTPDEAASPPRVNGRPRNPYHLHEWHREEFAALLRPHFEEVEIRAQVESRGLARRIEAVAALREGLAWSNPLFIFFWRKLRRHDGKRPWKTLAGLAAPAVADYPIVPLELAPLVGRSCFHVALCRRPKSG